MRSTVLTFAALAALAVPAFAGAEPLLLRVRHDGAFSNTDGALVFGEEAVEFQRSDGREPRRWAYDRLTRVVIAPTTLRLHTGGRRGWISLRRGGRDSFHVSGEPIEPRLVTFLLRKVPAPVFTTVLPDHDSWQVTLPARHERRRHASEGELRLAPDGGLAFVTPAERQTRFWRPRDVAAVLPLPDDRLQIDVVEVIGGRPQPYVFRLRQPLSGDAYRLLWSQFTRGGQS